MMSNTINEIKNSLEGINSRITEAEEWISDLEGVEANSCWPTLRECVHF